MQNYKLNETVFIAKPNLTFAVPGEAFKAAFVSMDSKTGAKMVVMKNIQLHSEDEDFEEETFLISEDRLSILFDVIEETTEEFELLDPNKLKTIHLGDLERVLFGRELSNDERLNVMAEMGVEQTAKNIIAGKHPFVGSKFTPKLNFHNFVIGQVYELEDVAIGEDLGTPAYLFKFGKEIYSLDTKEDFTSLFNKI